MGGKSGQTIGYRYLHLFFEIWAQHVDTLHRFVAGGKRAWTGCVHENETIQINAPAIWGDDEDNGEGGIVGPMDVQFGLADQPVNARMGDILGARQTGNRGWFSTVFEGIFGSYIPNPKTRSVLLERIHAGWPGGEAWYPETAAIPILEQDGVSGGGGGGSPGGPDVPTEFVYNIGRRVMFGAGSVWSGDTRGTVEMAEAYGFPYTVQDQAFWSWRAIESGLYYIKLTGEGDVVMAESLLAQGWQPNEAALAKFNDGDLRMIVLTLTDAPPYAPTGYTWVLTAVEDMASVHGPVWMWRITYGVVGLVAPSEPPDVPTGLCDINSMNPAHIIRYMLTQKKQIPDAMLSDASFEYAADVLFAEGFGLCEEFDPDGETPEAFILRICDIIGACCTQSKTDGLIYLDLLRNDYDKETLPVLTDDDIVDWQEDQAVPAELTNSVQIGWRDVLVDGGLERITPPAKALGHIRTHGREMNQVIDMRGIPFEHIAMRVGEREKKARSLPLVRLSPTTFRRHAYLRPGMPLLINCPKRGRVGMVVRVGEVDHGTPTDARLRWVLLQDVFDLPATVELDPTTIHDDDDPPVNAAGEVAIEAPYIELVATLPADRMAAVGEESGFLLTGVTAPTRGTNYGIYSKLSSEDYERRAFSDFCPTAVTVGAALPLDAGVQLTSGRLLERVVVGSWLLWENEICRVDGIDGDLILTMGRGCADTVPAKHDPGTRIFFLGDWNGTDQREYANGDELAVKLPVRTGSDEQPLADKARLEVTFAQRWFRPYPPGNLMLNGEPFYASGAITTSPPGGGGGGGGGPSSPPATGSNGAPASQELGPDGGFPDNGPPLFPLPTVFGTNVVDDPGMDDPATLSRWRKKDGSALGPEWSLTGGKLQLQAGVGTYEAYDFGTRFSKPYMPFPRLVIDTTADVQNTPGTLSSIGVAWGTWQSSNMPEYLEVSDPAAYLDEDSVTHSWAQEIKHAGGGVGIIGEYSVINFVPMVRHVVTTDLATCTVDNVDMQITEIDPAVTAETITNLDLSAGLTGITLWPDPSDTNPYLPDISVVAGVAIADFHTENFDYRWLIWDDPLTATDLDKFVRLRLKGWSNDPTVLSNSSKKFYPFGGVTAGLAYKNPGGDLTAISAAGRVERGDFTPREYYHHVAHAAASGYTVHAAVLMVGSVDTQAKFIDLEVDTTVDDYPESP